jgi:hypothetical protein
LGNALDVPKAGRARPVELNNGCMAINIAYQAGQPITLPVEKTKAGGGFIKKSLPQAESALQSFFRVLKTVSNSITIQNVPDPVTGATNNCWLALVQDN